MFSHSFSNLWLIIQHARSHGQWAGCWGIFIVAALRCIEKHCIVLDGIALHCIALHYIETHPGSIHRSSSHREEMSRNAMKHGSVASLTLMSCCGSWVTSFWGFLHSVFAQIYNRKQMLEETHIEPGWVWDDATSAVVWDVGMGTLGSLICNLESKLWEDCSWEFYKV